MALSLHALCRVYGEVFGSPPFETSAGVTAFSRVKNYPIAPNTYLPMTNATIWPLPNGFNIGTNVAYYVYSVVELPPTGLNQPSTKYVTDQLAATLAAAAT